MDTLTTLGITDHVQRRNKIKGIAQEILIQEVEKGMTKTDVSATTIIQDAIKVFGDNKYFFCKNMIQLYNGVTKETVTYKKYEGLSENRLTKDFHRVKDTQPYILVSAKFTKKRGWTSLGRAYLPKTLFKVLGRPIRVKRKGEKDLFKQACSVDTFKELRTDYVYFDGESIRVFESKNKEDTLLNPKDIGKSMKYPLLFKAIGTKHKDFQIIYNGGYTQHGDSMLEYYRERYDLNIKPPKLITKYLQDSDTDIYGIRVNGLPVKKHYEVLRSNNPSEYIIDLTPLKEEENE